MLDSSFDLFFEDDPIEWQKVPNFNRPQEVKMKVCRPPYDLGWTMESVNILDIFFKDFESFQTVYLQCPKRKTKIIKNHRKFCSWRKAKKYAKKHGIELFESPMILIPRAKVTVEDGNVKIVAKENE